MIFKIGAKVYANSLQRGTIVQPPQGDRIHVDRVQLGYDTVTLHTITGVSVTLDYAELVEVLGYYNP